jgi:O-antigen ligase
MASLAINVLWFLIGLIVLCGVVWLAIWVIEQFIMPIPEQIKKGIWVIVLLLALIFLITVIAGGGSFPRIFHGGKSGGTFGTLPIEAAGYL